MNHEDNAQVVPEKDTEMASRTRLDAFVPSLLSMERRQTSLDASPFNDSDEDSDEDKIEIDPNDSTRRRRFNDP